MTAPLAVLVEPEDFLRIVTSVMSVFGIIAVGAICRTRNWLTKHADMSLAKLTANVLLPSLFLDRILGDESLDRLVTAWPPPVFGFAITSLGFLLAYQVARLVGPRLGLVTDASQRAFALCAGVCNYGYIPLPLVQIFYPKAEVELILHNVGVDLALWSVGIAIVTGGRGLWAAGRGGDPQADQGDGGARTTTRENRPGRSSGRPDRTSGPFLWGHRVRSFLPKVLSPPLIAVSIGLTLRATHLDDYVPTSLRNSVSLLAASSIPMGLLLSGAIIIDFVRAADWSGSVKVIAAAIGFRQLLMPLIVLGVATWLAPTIDLQHVLILQASMPSAIFPIVLVRLSEGDTATALRVVLSTQLAAVVLIPVWMATGAWWLGTF